VIVELKDTTTSAIAKRLIAVREEGGAVALGRVLTLVIAVEHADHEAVIEAANEASGEHPMRILVVHAHDPESEVARLDAEIRVGGDAGASDVVVLDVWGPAGADPETLVNALLLPDAPVIVWWPNKVVDSPSTSPLGSIAQLRITDTPRTTRGPEVMGRIIDGYRPGDVDLAWTRLTLWRTQLAAVLDREPFEPVSSARVAGIRDSTSTLLMAAWLRLTLGVPVEIEAIEPEVVVGNGSLSAVELRRTSGSVVLERITPSTVRLLQPGEPEQHITIRARTLPEVLAEELRSLAPDRVLGAVLGRGLPALLEELAA